MTPKLHCKQGTPFTNLALITAEYANVKIDSKFGNRTTIKLEVDATNHVSQPSGVALYLASTSDQLSGKSEVQQAQIIEWLFRALNDVYNGSCAWVLPAMGIQPGSPDKAKNEMKNFLKQLNDYLQTRTFLVSERVSLADIALACVLLPVYQNVMDPNFRKPYGNVNRWFMTCINQPQFAKVIGKPVVLCEKEPTGKAVAAKKEKPKKEAAAPEPAAEEPPKPKEKDPLSLLPKGNFDMDDFKRFYSNNDEDKSVPYFWEKFDKEAYSIWYGEYKYPDELTMVFMSCNLIGGMFQRLEKLRKHAFASMCLFGENNNSTISGIWIWRGHELAFEQSDDWQIDYGSYDWKKLDSDSDETKKLVEQYLKWEGCDKGGRKFNQGKIFK